VPDPLLPGIVRVLRRRREAPGVWTLELEPQVGRPEPFGPGQFNMLTVFGVGEIPISLSGDPARQERLVHTLRAVGPVSAALTSLGAGAALGLRGPFGTGWPLEAAAGRRVVVVAGGLGLAPLRPALCALLAEPGRHDGVTLLYGARSPADALFRRELEKWRKRIGVEITVDHADLGWRGHVGVVTRLVPEAVRDPARTVAFVCGPEVMMRFAVAALRDAGVADDAIHLSLERNMKCAVGLCGRCQLGTVLVCRDGPVLRYDRVRELLGHKEI
jgi:NAD(P)H-flavin reductase